MESEVISTYKMFLQLDNVHTSSQQPAGSHNVARCRVAAAGLGCTDLSETSNNLITRILGPFSPFSKNTTPTFPSYNRVRLCDKDNFFWKLGSSIHFQVYKRDLLLQIFPTVQFRLDQSQNFPNRFIIEAIHRPSTKIQIYLTVSRIYSKVAQY